MSYKDLNSSLKSGEVRAVDAVRAYQWAALKANSRLNCVCQFIREAEEWAEACDAMPQEDRAGRPLHGIPISVKDNYEVKGYAITAGSPRMINNICEKDALVVEIIREMGGIPFCVTNVPQSCLTLQCSNPVFGITGNPYDPDKSCGGSSGGEGSLIGAGGSILGVGNDVGGSLRCPATFCGIYTLKPTYGRHISMRGAVSMGNPKPGPVRAVSGFMSASVDGL